MSNAIHDLAGKEEKHRLGDIGSTFTHDVIAVATLRDILIELKKMNMHLEYISGIQIEDYNVEGS